MIIGFPPGGGTDIIGRIVAQKLSEGLVGAEPVGNTPEEFAAFTRAETEKYARIVKAANIKVE